MPAHLLKNILLAGASLAGASGAAAQPGCPKPVVQVLRGQVEVPAAGSPLGPRATLQVRPDPACSTPARYTFSSAELTLVRHGRPVLPTRRVAQPQLDLQVLAQASQPGDHLHVFIPYASLLVVAADGQQQPYQPPQRPQPSRPPIDLIPDEAKGISFNWLVTN